MSLKISQNYSKACIKNYLYGYLSEIKNNKIKQNYNEAKEIYRNISKYVDHYVIRYPSNVSILTGDSKYLQDGGAIMDQEFVDKMGKVATIFKMYKEMNLTDIRDNTKKLKEDLDVLLKEVQTLNPNDLDSLNISSP
jgi:hypothetical protein